MDPLTALIIAMWLAGRFTKNVYQDSVYKARGEDPPSFRREQERWERRQQKRATGDGPGRKLIGNAWADACAAADDRRDRLARRAAERRQAKWAGADVDAAEAEAREINERLDKGAPETVHTCVGCQARLPQSEVAGYALSGDPLCRTCRTSPVVPKQAPAPNPSSGQGWPRRCHACGRLTELTNLRTASCLSCPGDEGDAVDACVGCLQATRKQQDTADKAAEAAEDGHLLKLQPTSEPHATAGSSKEPNNEPDSDANPGATVTNLTEWRSKGALPPITKEDLMSGETTNLSAALQYAQDMADQCGAGAASTETSIATMRSGGVTGPVLDHFAQAQEHLSAAMAAFNCGYAELQGDVAVKDAYQSRQGAGDKEFVLQD